MDDWSLELRVVYEELPHMIEVETRVRTGEWSACSRAYCRPNFLIEDATQLVAWSHNPQGHFRFEAGSDTGVGWLVLEFYTVDRAGHTRCAVTLSQAYTLGTDNTKKDWRFAVELKTEPVLIERFGRECMALGRDYSRVARLFRLP